MSLILIFLMANIQEIAIQYHLECIGDFFRYRTRILKVIGPLKKRVPYSKAKLTLSTPYHPLRSKCDKSNRIITNN